MATSLLVLLDDLTSALDDVALLTKIAVRKTAGVLGDDLAVNAEQVRGLAAARELPVVWAVFNLETAVERFPGCVPPFGKAQRGGIVIYSSAVTPMGAARGVPPGCNQGTVAAYTQKVMSRRAQNPRPIQYLCPARSGQLPFLGSFHINRLRYIAAAVAAPL